MVSKHVSVCAVFLHTNRRRKKLKTLGLLRWLKRKLSNAPSLSTFDLRLRQQTAQKASSSVRTTWPPSTPTSLFSKKNVSLSVQRSSKTLNFSCDQVWLSPWSPTASITSTVHSYSITVSSTQFVSAEEICTVCLTTVKRRLCSCYNNWRRWRLRTMKLNLHTFLTPLLKKQQQRIS